MRILADARQIPLMDGCVQCVVTSPPYFGLRDYGLSAQIGLESSPDAYVAQLVAVFREVRRVLKADGTVWLNLGDSYASGEVGRVDAGRTNDPTCGKNEKWLQQKPRAERRLKLNTGLKHKDLVGIPWRVAFALQADGWYLRSDVIWSKLNPMPESVTDRPTKAHEYVFLLSKSERYFFDAEAVREPYLMSSWTAESDADGKTKRGVMGARSGGKTAGRIGEADGSVEERHRRAGKTSMTGAYANGGRNIRSVWSIATQPYAGAHFATMPEKLVERCILSGSRPGDLVLDPFGGSGTTVRVARRFNRRGVMLDLNPAYLELARERISGIQPSVFEVSA